MLVGLVVAWAASVVAAVAAAWIYAVYSMIATDGYVVELVTLGPWGPKDALTYVLVAGYTAAISAAPIALVGIFGVAWPFYRLSGKLQRIRSNGWRVLAGLAVAWAASVAVGIGAACIYMTYSAYLGGETFVAYVKEAVSEPRNFLTGYLIASAVTAYVAVPTSYFGVFGMGWPFYLLSRRRRWVTRWHYGASGLGIALVAYPVSLLFFGGLGLDFERYVEIAAFVIAGPVGMLAFWWVVRPDRTG